VPGDSRLSFLAVALLLAALGFAGGFFIVPISALIQHIPAEEHKGGVLGAANWLSFVGVGVASGAYYLVAHWARLSPARFFFGRHSDHRATATSSICCQTR